MKTIGVIGLGSIGMRHAKNLQAMGHQIIVYDPNINNIPHPFMERAESLQDMDITDAMIIASPTPTHLIYWANEANKPVFIEKPIADTRNLPAVRFELNKRSGQITMVGNNLRFRGCIVTAKEFLERGAVGVPSGAHFTLSQYSDKEPYLRDGVISNWGAHEIDLALHLFGPATLTTASMERPTPDSAEDSADLYLRHESGCVSTIHLDYRTKPERRDFIVFGPGGLMHVDVVNGDIGTVKATGEILSYSCPDTFDENYVDEMKAFIDLIDGKPVPHAATGADGLATLEIILQAKKVCGL